MVFTTEGIRRALIQHSAKLVDKSKDIKLELLMIAEHMLLSGDIERFKQIPSLGIKDWAAIAYYWAAAINEWRANKGFKLIVEEASTLLIEALDTHLGDEVYFRSCKAVSKLFTYDESHIDADAYIGEAYKLHIASMGPIVLLVEDIEAHPWNERFLLASVKEDSEWQKTIDKRLLFASHLEAISTSLFDHAFQYWDELDDESKDVLEELQEKNFSLYGTRDVDPYQSQIATIERWFWNFALSSSLDKFIAEMNVVEVPTRLATKDDIQKFYLLDGHIKLDETTANQTMPILEPILYGQLPLSLDLALSCLDRFSVFSMLLHNIYGLDEREDVEELEELNQHLHAEDVRHVLKDLILMNFSSYLSDSLGMLSDGLQKLVYANGRIWTTDEIMDEVDLIRQGFIFCVLQDSGSRLFLPQELHEILIEYLEQLECERNSLR